MTAATQVELDVGRASRRVAGVVGEIASREGALVRRGRRIIELVVSDIDEAIETAVENGAAVVAPGRRSTVAHRIARPAKRRVAEARRKLDERQPGALIERFDELAVVG